MTVLAALALALLAPQEPSGSVRSFPPEKPLTVPALEEELDRSVHWLRAQFDPEQGSYGSLAADAWALLALAACPRRYRTSEGPFLDRPLARVLAAQRADGSFGDAVTDQAASAALRLLGEGERAERVPSPHAIPRPQEATPAAVQALAKELLLARRADGSFGDLLATAQTIERLSWCHGVLKAAEPKKAPKEAKALPRFDEETRASVESALARGAQYLLSQRIAGGFGFDGRADAGITAMAVGALLAVPEPRPAPLQAAIVESLDTLAGLQKEDGSIHEGQIANYVTSAAVLALARGRREADRVRIERATEFLKALQSDEGEGYASESRYYGGVGYGNDERPDLSNLQMALEALHTAGTPASDPAFQKALQFLQRCQNRSESNDLTIATDGRTLISGNDGGAGYAPGESKAGYVRLADGREVPRSYGSMSYALLKGYLFAGLAKDDPRVEAVWRWLRANYTLDVNPGFQASEDPTASYQGLFYYFYTMAKALDLYGEAMIQDAAGKPHDWRAELCGRLLSMQRGDGSWVNENSSKWFEGNPVLATSYALLTLEAARGAP